MLMRTKEQGCGDLRFQLMALGTYISKAKEIFFNKKKTFYGNEEDLKLFFGNFRGEFPNVPNGERFILLNELQHSYAIDTSIDLEAIKEEE